MAYLLVSLLLLACMCSLGQMSYLPDQAQADANAAGGLLAKLRGIEAAKDARGDGEFDPEQEQALIRRCLRCILDAEGGEGELEEVIGACAVNFINNPDATCDEALNIAGNKKRFFHLHFHFHLFGKKK